MLILLKIINFALVDSLELEFGSGLNVLTGETGAGKSIILDALDVALGGRVGSFALRTGTDKALIEATFAINHIVLDWLAKQEIGLLEDQTIVCTRELSLISGSLRSRSRINGVVVNRQIMEDLRSHLIEITAQGQTVMLLQANQQRQWLDIYGGTQLLKQRSQVQKVFEEFQSIEQALNRSRQSEQQRLQRLDLLQYQAKELQEAQLDDPNEHQELEQEKEILSHVVELQKLSYQVYQILYQNDGEAQAASDLLGQAESLLSGMVKFDSSIQSILDLVSNALAQVLEAGHLINSYGDNLEADPNRLEDIQERIRLLKQIQRKYGPTLSEAIAYRDGIESELTELHNSTQLLEELENKYQTILKKLDQECSKLTTKRQEAGALLSQQLIAQLKPLAMDKVQFEIRITPTPPSPIGADQIVFYFSANPGEALQPLSVTASGGEMSRFLLALKSCFSQIDPNITLIFDEIDVGVSGKVAEAIADKLHQLSQYHQVLSVTHQPLIAAMADHHFRVTKQVIPSSDPSDSITERTVVRVTTLDPTQRCEEVATLAGGKSAQDAMTFAKSLLNKAAKTKTARVVINQRSPYENNNQQSTIKGKQE